VTFSVNLEKWNSLPANVREAIAEIGRKMSLEACAKFDKAEEDAIAEARAGSIKLVDPRAGDHAELDKAFERVRTDWAKRLDRRGKDGSAVLAAFVEAAEAAKPQ
jgi:TRAP-type C4-dicarboxylate transport system substrate-binding protein